MLTRYAERKKAAFESFYSRAGCNATNDKISCLRSLSYKEFYDAHEAITDHWTLAPRVDGDFMVDFALEQLKTGKFNKVAYILGDNSEDATASIDFIFKTE